MASAVAVVASWIVDSVGVLSRTGWHADFWPTWVGSALTLKQPLLLNLAPGIVLNMLAAVLGGLAAHAVLESGGRVRVFGIGRLKLNLNARIFTYFLQQPVGGALYRVQLSDGSRYVGQVGAFSSDPNDDVQDVILRDYSHLDAANTLKPVADSREMLITRAVISTIELLIYRIPDKK